MNSAPPLRVANPVPTSAIDGILPRLGKYQIGRTLGQGQFGKVKYGIDTIAKTEVAIKIMDKAKIQERHMGEQIKKEISIMKMINHPSVVRIIEVLSTATTIFLVLEYVPGGELFEGIVRNGRCEEASARNYFRQLISAIEYCHAQGVCHRDLKPENLLLGANGELKITDFNLSRIFSDENTVLQTACGTPNYVAPEVLKGEGYDGPPADVWSAGVILYVMLAGFLPFDELNMTDLFRKIVQADFSYPKWFSEDSINLLSTILQPDPTKRATLKDIKAHGWFTGGGGLSDEKEIPKLVPDKASLERAITMMDELDSDTSDYDSELDVTTNVVPAQFRDPVAEGGRRRAQTTGGLRRASSGQTHIRGGNRGSDAARVLAPLTPQTGERGLDLDLAGSSDGLGMESATRLLMASAAPFSIDLDGSASSSASRPGTKSAGSATGTPSKPKRNKAAKTKISTENSLSPPTSGRTVARPRGMSDITLSQPSSATASASASVSVSALGKEKDRDTSSSGAIVLNAFDLINMVGGAAMNRMFQKGDKKLAFFQFRSALPATQIMDIMVEVLDKYPRDTTTFQVFAKKCAIHIKVKTAVGLLAMQTQLYEMTPELHMIELKKQEGDQASFQRFYEQLKLDFVERENLKKARPAALTVSVNNASKAGFLSPPERHSPRSSSPLSVSVSPATSAHTSPALTSASPHTASPGPFLVPAPVANPRMRSASAQSAAPSSAASSVSSPASSSPTPSRPTNLASLTVTTIMSGGGMLAPASSPSSSSKPSPLALSRSITPSSTTSHASSAPSTPVQMPAHHSGLTPLSATSPVSMSASLAAAIVATTLGGSFANVNDTHTAASASNSSTPTTSPPLANSSVMPTSPGKAVPHRTTVAPNAVSRPLFVPNQTQARRSSDVANQGPSNPSLNLPVNAPPSALPTNITKRSPFLPSLSAQNPDQVPALTSDIRKTLSLSSQPINNLPVSVADTRPSFSTSRTGPALRKSVSAPADNPNDLSSQPSVRKASSSPAQPIAVRDSAGVNRFSISMAPPPASPLSPRTSDASSTSSPTNRTIDV